MHISHLLSSFALYASTATCLTPTQNPLLHHARTNRNVSLDLFVELEELARLVDIAYCVGGTSTGISKPFKCLSRCSDFPDVELVDAWNTGPLLSDSCGYIALDHAKERIIVAFRGTYSVANTVVDLSTVPQEYVPYPGSDDGDGTLEKWSQAEMVETRCLNCTVHMGFHRAWLNTRTHILSDLTKQVVLYPHYDMHLVGHSLGGAVAALAALDLLARGWDPTVTTFGEPRIGNAGLAKYLDECFNLIPSKNSEAEDEKLRYRRVTHIDDPVPLLPLTEWSYAMHAGEIFISKPALSPDVGDLEHCDGESDQKCIAGQDATTAGEQRAASNRKRDLIESVQDEMHDVAHEPWGIPSRYKLWQLFFAHRDYFWRIGLCVPGGDPLGGGRKYIGDELKEDLR